MIGIHDGMPEAKYHDSLGLSYSGLKEFATSPAHFQTWKLERIKPTKAMELGRETHMAILEPERFEALYVAEPAHLAAMDGRTKAYKDAVAALEKETGKQVADVRAFRIRDAVHKNPVVREILSQGKPEQSVFWDDPDTAVRCKARVDWLRPDNLILDLKTTSKGAGPTAFMREVGKLRYHWQTAFYLWGVAKAKRIDLIRDFVHLVVETDAPFGVALYALDDKSISQGWREIRPLIDKYADRVNRNQWEGYPTEIQPLSIPQWCFEQAEA